MCLLLISVLMKMLYKYLYFVVYSASLSSCANILALIPGISHSHHLAFAPLWQELSQRGHNVTLLTTHPIKDLESTNINQLDINWVYGLLDNYRNLVENAVTMWNFHTFISDISYITCSAVLSSNIGKELLNEQNKFDLVIVQSVCPEYLAFAEVYKCPKILISTMGLNSIFHSSIGDFTHPVLYPDITTPFHGNLDFKERVISTVVSWYWYFMFAFVHFPEKERYARKHFNSTSTIKEMIRDTDMFFINVNPLIHGPRALGPATITIGGHRKDITLEEIPLDLKVFLDGANEGCILVCLGTNLKTNEMSESLLRPMIEALGEVPYKVIWKVDSQISNIPKNIKTAKWLPQKKILNHPNLKLFISHGGLHSLEESVYAEVPFVVIPFFADQYQNSRILENKGIAVVLDKTTLHRNDLSNAILKVMNEPSYYNRVKELKQLILDETMTGLEKAVWWTEYVIRNKGAKHLRNPAADLPFYQYYLFDVIGFLSTVITLLLVIAIITFYRMYRLLRYFNNKEKLQ